MSGFNLQLDATQLQRVETYLQGIRGAFPKVQERALNKAIKGVKTDASKEIRSEVALKAKYVNRSMRVLRASAKRGVLAAGLESTGSPVPLVGYKTRQLKSGVKVQVNKDRASSVIPHAFIATMGSGHKGIFQRKIRHEDHYDRSIPFSERGKQRPNKQFAAMPKKYRGPIKELFGPAVPSIFKRNDVMQRLKHQGQERLSRHLDQELNYMLHRSGRSIENI